MGNSTEQNSVASSTSKLLGEKEIRGNLETKRDTKDVSTNLCVALIWILFHSVKEKSDICTTTEFYDDIEITGGWAVCGLGLGGLFVFICSEKT